MNSTMSSLVAFNLDIQRIDFSTTVIVTSQQYLHRVRYLLKFLVFVCCFVPKDSLGVSVDKEKKGTTSRQKQTNIIVSNIQLELPHGSRPSVDDVKVASSSPDVFVSDGVGIGCRHVRPHLC